MCRQQKYALVRNRFTEIEIRQPRRISITPSFCSFRHLGISHHDLGIKGCGGGLEYELISLRIRSNPNHINSGRDLDSPRFFLTLGFNLNTVTCNIRSQLPDLDLEQNNPEPREVAAAKALERWPWFRDSPCAGTNINMAWCLSTLASEYPRYPRSCGAVLPASSFR